MSAAGSFHCPVRLIWGAEALSHLAECLTYAGITRPLIVSDPAILAGPAGRLLRAALPEAALHDSCGVDARAEDIAAACDRLRAAGCDGVLGLGGGSALCTAKATAIAATCGTDLRRLEGAPDLPAPPLPMVLIPSTAGSGTEVSPYTILRDAAGKFTIGGPSAFARVALLDPRALDGAPRGVAAAAMADALSHALEAATSQKATPVSDALALRALRLLAGAAAAALDPGEPAARIDCLLGSALANMACGQARLGLAHRLARPLEGATGASHGAAIAALLPVTLPAALAARPHIAPELAAAIGAPDAAAIPDAVASRLWALGLAPRLTARPEAAAPRALAEAALWRPGEPEPGPPHDAALVPAANGAAMPLSAAAAALEAVLAR
ncbi:iron-containing alcohol dehydrogenase [Roseivivax sp. CAU 1761]